MSHHTTMHTQQGTHQSQVVLGLSVGEQGENREAPLSQAPYPPHDCAPWHHALASKGSIQLRAVPGTGFAPSRMVQAEIQVFLLGSPRQHGTSQLPRLQQKIPLQPIHWQGTHSQPTWCPHRPPGTHQMMHQPLPALRGDHAQVRLAAVGGELCAM